SFRRRSAMCEPINPAPPVTRILISATAPKFAPTAPLSGEPISFEEVQIGGSPIPKPADTVLLVNQRPPAQTLASLSNIADIARLVARPPIAEIDRKISPAQSRQDFPELRPD